jgi:hypothetical protein
MDQTEKKLDKMRIQLKNMKFKEFTKLKKSDSALRSEFTKVDKMKESDLSFELQKAEVEAHSSFTNRISEVVRDTCGQTIDYLLKGDGHILDQFKKDENLRECLTTELENIVGQIGNKARIVTLSTSNVFHGIQNKKKGPVEQQKAPVQEEKK